MDTEYGISTSGTLGVAEASSTPVVTGDTSEIDVQDISMLLPHLVISFEAVDLILAPCPDGFMYEISTRDGLGSDILAIGGAKLNGRGKLLIDKLLQLFQDSGPLRGESFEARVIVD